MRVNRAMLRKGVITLAVAAAAGLAATPVFADKIKNPTAVFAGLDKITGRIISFEVAIDETVQFGSLQLTPRVCYSRPGYENPQTDTFVEVDEIASNNEYKRLFTGWMFAASPGLNAVEHPVYDLWLTDCKGGTQIIKQEQEKEELPPIPQAEARKAQQDPKKSAQSNRPAQPRANPSQSFFPTNAPPSPSGSGTIGRPMSIIPAGPDPARGGN